MDCAYVRAARARRDQVFGVDVVRIVYRVVRGGDAADGSVDVRERHLHDNLVVDRVDALAAAVAVSPAVLHAEALRRRIGAVVLAVEHAERVARSAVHLEALRRVVDASDGGLRVERARHEEGERLYDLLVGPEGRAPALVVVHVVRLGIRPLVRGGQAARRLLPRRHRAHDARCRLAFIDGVVPRLVGSVVGLGAPRLEVFVEALVGEREVDVRAVFRHLHEDRRELHHRVACVGGVGDIRGRHAVRLLRVVGRVEVVVDVRLGVFRVGAVEHAGLRHEEAAHPVRRARYRVVREVHADGREVGVRVRVGDAGVGVGIRLVDGEAKEDVGGEDVVRRLVDVAVRRRREGAVVRIGRAVRVEIGRVLVLVAGRGRQDDRAVRDRGRVGVLLADNDGLLPVGGRVARDHRVLRVFPLELHARARDELLGVVAHRAERQSLRLERRDIGLDCGDVGLHRFLCGFGGPCGHRYCCHIGFLL